MARYKVILAYDGTAFNGFQRQKEVRTVQAEVETALRRTGWPGRTIYAAGRTDAGVHAAGQVLAFDFEWRHAAGNLCDAINANLPDDIAARQVLPAADDFHPRFDALARRYAYRMLFEPVRNPLGERYAWRLWPPLARDLLNEAAAVFIGTHDFAAFGTPPTAGGSTIRQVFAAEWTFDERAASFTIEANAFLFRMVRRIVKAQVDAAQGKIKIEKIHRLLQRDGGSAAPEMLQGLAPAHGLTMVAVRYPDDDD